MFERVDISWEGFNIGGPGVFAGWMFYKYPGEAVVSPIGESGNWKWKISCRGATKVGIARSMEEGKALCEEHFPKMGMKILLVEYSEQLLEEFRFARDFDIDVFLEKYISENRL
jgi:hypothetical protein